MWPFVLTAYASLDDTIKKINKAIINPLIVLMFAIAAIYFLYGLFEFIKDADNSDARETGKNHIIWGLIGMFIMVSVYFIMQLILGTLGIGTEQINISPTGIEVNLPPMQE
jgi:uncharacterized membrane protein YidH (DUF202 family)